MFGTVGGIIRNNAVYCSEGAEVQEWFEACIIRSYGNPIIEMEVMFSEDANVKKQIVTLLNDMGIDIEDYRFDSDEKQLYLKRTIAGMPYELSLDEESNGTRKEEYAKEAESAYQQIIDLIDRFQKIDAAIVASNANTEITTSYGTFTVAGAIALRSRLRGAGAEARRQ